MQKRIRLLTYESDDPTHMFSSSFRITFVRLDYLKNANLFADDVRKEHDAHERQKFKEALIANREKSADGSDLGLW